MQPKRKSRSLDDVPLQAAPSPHPRTAPIGANDPSRLYFIPAGHDPFFVESRHGSVPQQSNSRISRPLHHSLVQHFAPHTEPRSVRKTGAHRRTLIFESNASM